MMSSSAVEKDLEAQLVEVGKKLQKPPEEPDQLLPLLEVLENCLGRVEQSPSKSMTTILCPSMNMLVSPILLKHSDKYVRLSVATCLSEITRITAPDAPYDDDLMKEIFKLIVNTFEDLSDAKTPYFGKRVLILETVAKVRSCVVMLDLECDNLILEMFGHFIKTIREDHAECVFSSMEGIMTVVLEESEDIPSELLTLLLNNTKPENHEVSPVARRLVEKVMENCAAKLKPFLLEAAKESSISARPNSKMIAEICEGTVENQDPALSGASSQNLEDGKDVLLKVCSAENSEKVEQQQENLSLKMVDDDESTKSPSNGPLSSAKDDSSKKDSKDNSSKEDHSPPKSEVIGLEKGTTSSEVACEDANLPSSIVEAMSDQETKKASEVETKDDTRKSSIVETKDDATKKSNKVETKDATKKASKVETKDDETKKASRAETKGDATKKASRAELKDSATKKATKAETKDDATKKATKAETKDDTTTKATKAETKDDTTKKASNVETKDDAIKKTSKVETKDDAIRKTKGRKPNAMKSPSDGSDDAQTVPEDKTTELPKSKRGRKKKVEPLQSEGATSKDVDITSEPEKEIITEPAGVVSAFKSQVPDSARSKRRGKAAVQKGDTKTEAEPSTLPAEDVGNVADGPEKENLPDPSRSKRARGNSTAHKGDTKPGSEPSASPVGEVGAITSDTDESSPLVAKTFEKGKKRKKSTESDSDQRSSKKDATEDDENITLSKSLGRKVKSFGGKIEDHRTVGSADKKSTASKKSARVALKEEGDTSIKSSTVKKTPGRRPTPKDETRGSAEHVNAYDESLVGSQIKVYWPLDKKFYKGTIVSFDPLKKKHKVSYADGDEEELLLSKERWEHLEVEKQEVGHSRSAVGVDSSVATPSPKKRTKTSSSSSKAKDVDDESPVKKRKESVPSKSSKSATPKSVGKAQSNGSSVSKGKPGSATKSVQPESGSKGKKRVRGSRG